MEGEDDSKVSKVLSSAWWEVPVSPALQAEAAELDTQQDPVSKR